MKKAFTLAEVLITLGIIGVVASLTIPQTIANHQKLVTEAKLKKAYSILNQASQRATMELGVFSDEDARNTSAEVYFGKYWKPYIEIAEMCTSSTSYCGYKTTHPFKYLYGQGILDGFLHPADGHIAFKTKDNIMFSIFTRYTDSGYRTRNWLWVDINGPQKPNKVGKDVFLFTRGQKNGIILPGCYSDQDKNINDDCKKTGFGYCCAEKIRRSEWKIDKTYPW